MYERIDNLSFACLWNLPFATCGWQKAQLWLSGTSVIKLYFKSIENLEKVQ